MKLFHLFLLASLARGHEWQEPAERVNPHGRQYGNRKSALRHHQGPREHQARPREHHQERPREYHKDANEERAKVSSIEEKALCAESNLVNARCFMDTHPEMYRKSNAIAKILIYNGGSSSMGTGWLAGPNNYLVTNHHVISNQAEADRAYFLFNFESTSGGSCAQEAVNDPASPAKVIEGAQLVFADQARDIALVKLSGNPVCTFGYLDVESSRVSNGEEIYIPQHPSGRDKSIGLHDSTSSSGVCHISDDNYPNDYDIEYTCDTEGGSSGSPVISRSTNNVIGLHKAGRSNCGGNIATPSDAIYSMLAPHIYDGNSAMGSCTSPGSTVCEDNSNFVVPGWTMGGNPIECEDISPWKCGNAMTTEADGQGRTAVSECCICNGGNHICEDHAGWADEWDDGCDWYANNPGSCTQYDWPNPDGIKPSQACCVCHED